MPRDWQAAAAVPVAPWHWQPQASGHWQVQASGWPRARAVRARAAATLGPGSGSAGRRQLEGPAVTVTV